MLAMGFALLKAQAEKTALKQKTDETASKALRWKPDGKNRWIATNGEYIVKFNWGMGLGYRYLRYQSQEVYAGEQADYRSFEKLADAKKAEVVWEHQTKAGKLLSRLVG